MPRRARIHFVSLRSSLVNLPISIYGPLLERSIRPQHLAVHLTRTSGGQREGNEKLEAYVGWTGMASASSLAHFNASQSSGGDGFETIEIDPQYAQGLGFSQGDLVEIGLIHDMPQAKMVGTEPVTSDDWEITEIHASHVESTLLSQVRVAKVGQEIDVWVLGRTRVRLKVVNVDPPTKDNAVLLTTNTEVSIAPKPHKAKQQQLSKSIPDGKAVSEKASSSQAAPLTAKPKPVPTGKIEVFRVLPSRLVSSIPSYSGTELVAYVSPLLFISLFGSRPRKDSSGGFICHQAHFNRLSPPLNPSINPSPTTSALPPGPRVLKAGSAEKESSQEKQEDPRKTGEVYIGCLEDIVDEHLVFTALTDGIEEWDKVLVTAQAEANSITVTEPTERKLNVEPSTENFLAGVHDVLKECNNHCMRLFVLHSKERFVHGVPGILITGRQGAGKTTIARTVAKSLQEDIRTYTYIHHVDISKHVDTPVGKLKELFNYWFDKATWHKPTILLLDNLDKLLSAEVEHADSFRSRQLTEIFLSTYSSAARTAARNCRGIIIIATAISTASLHPLLNTMHVFKEVVHVQPPNKDARRDILARITEKTLESAKDITIDPEAPVNFTALATQTEGYSALDLQDLVARAIHQAAMRIARDDASTKLTYDDFMTAQADFVPLSLRDVKLQKSDVTWSDVGGLYETKRVLRETLEWPTKYAPIFKQSPLRLRSGLLLYGYPGCGKTLLASAVAKECGLNFISVKGPEILNKYIGASEQSVRELFERASAAKPCVLFFDEFDSIAPKRGHDSTGVTDRVVNQLLTQMDGAEGLDGVYVLAATSRPDLIDSALLRPGRLDKSLLCNMPDHAERKDILSAVSRKLVLSPSIDLDVIAAQTEGFSGADLQALLYNAHLEVVHESIEAMPKLERPGTRDNEAPLDFVVLEPGTNGSSTDGQGNVNGNRSGMSKAESDALQRRLRRILDNTRAQTSMSAEEKLAKTKAMDSKPKHEIRKEHILNVLKTTRPSVSPEERKRFDRIYQAFISDRSGELPVPPDAGGVGLRATLM